MRLDMVFSYQDEEDEAEKRRTPQIYNKNIILYYM